MNQLDKTIPANPEAEEAVLGSLLIDPDAVIKIASFLEVDDFYREKNGWIYQAVLDLHEKREPADFVTLVDELERRNILHEVGGAAYITALVNSVPSAVYVEHYAHIVERAAVLRRLIGAAGQIASLAYEEADDVDEVVDRAEQLIFNVSERRVRRDLIPVRQVMHSVVDRIDYLHRHQGDVMGVPTGFAKLDKLLGGFQKSDLVILAARPSVGKCIVSGSRLLDPETGRRVTIDDLVQQRQGRLLSLDEHFRLQPAAPSDFVDDGLKPVFRVRTKLGREITATASHPFLTIDGWWPLVELAPGQRIAVPRALPYFGSKEIPEAQVKILAYLIADGCLTSTVPQFTNQNIRLREDFEQAVGQFPGITTRTRDSGGTRTPTVFTVGEPGFITSGRLEVSPALVSIWQDGTCVPSGGTFDRLCAELSVAPEALAPYGLSAISKNGKNPVTVWLTELELWGCDAHTKLVPPLVFELTRPLIALFLNRLFACDGSIYQGRSANPQISYSTVSHSLARDVQHLLLRFGIIAQLRHRWVSYAGGKREAYEIVITGQQDVLTFLDEIGAFGKEAQVSEVRTRCHERESRGDTVPIEFWAEILQAKGNLAWREVFRRLGYSEASNFHANRRAPTRQRLAELAGVFGDTKLADLAQSDVYWDTIDAIEYIGEHQVYDLTVDGTHNFVAEDMLVHNTSLALNFALNAARRFRKVVGFFSLEMSAEQIVQRLLSMETGIDQQRLRQGEIRDDEWDMLMRAAAELSETLLYIDDTPAMSAIELRTKARRLQAEHGLDLILVDYLQLMRGDNHRSENRVQEISYISRSLKSLARELEAPLIALSQLSRAVEQRTDHKPILSDLRESGCLTGDTLVTLAESGARVPIRELVGRSGFHVWALDETTWTLKLATVSHAFVTGNKPTLRLETRLGRIIRATANHKFRALAGWCRLDEFQVGARIALPRQVGCAQTGGLPLAQASLLGHLLGDGCTLPRHAIQYTTNEPDLAEHVADLAKQVFGERVQPRIKQERRWLQVYLAATNHLTHGVRNPVAEWLDGLGAFGQRAPEKRIPDAVFQSPDTVIAAFLRHLWATDGCVHVFPADGKHAPAIYYATSSEGLARDVQSLLLRLDINAIVRRRPQGAKGRPQFHVLVMGQTDSLAFAAKVGAVGERKATALAACAAWYSARSENTNRDVIPREIWRSMVVPIMQEQGVTTRSLQSAIGMAYMGTGLSKQNLSRERLVRVGNALGQHEVLTGLANSDVYWDEIVSIQPDGEEDVYDLTVPGPSNFVANDIIVHNSIEQDADIVMFIYREDMTKEDSERKNIADIIVAKHRNGPTDTIPLFFQKELTRFADLEYVREPLEVR